MKRLLGVEGFDWNEANLTKNWEKHRVTPWECEQAFFNLPLVVAEDSAHSAIEARYYVLSRLYHPQAEDSRHFGEGHEREGTEDVR
jgi:uncharacterized DUF497 family protein